LPFKKETNATLGCSQCSTGTSHYEYYLFSMLVTWLPSGCNRRLITPQKIWKNKLKRTGILPPARAVSRHTSKTLRPLEVEQTGDVAGKETEPR
jgi:hypothetical protein